MVCIAVSPAAHDQTNTMEQATVNTIVQSVEFSSFDLIFLIATIVVLGIAIFGSLNLLVQRNSRFSSEFGSTK
jgi:hypothetical protein